MKRFIKSIFIIGIIMAILSFFYQKISLDDKKNTDNKTLVKEDFDEPEQFTKYFRQITTEIGKLRADYPLNYKVIERKKAISILKKNKRAATVLDWKSRGPANVGGRTRAILIDPDDNSHKTWIVGAASGGIWKTTDAGNTWLNLSDDLSNLSVNSLVMCSSNTDVIFAGTGESFPGGTYLKGNGIWKSIDRGSTWTQLSSTATDENFSYVNRLIASTTDADIVLAATETGIFKTTDGGISWQQVYASDMGVEDIVASPLSFDTIYAGENSVGILKSVDSGNTWFNSSTGITVGNRYELDISPVNTSTLYVSVNISDTESNVFISKDAGQTWMKFNDAQNFLGGQGAYDNIIAAHPYIEDEVYVGGVDIWHLKFDGTDSVSAPMVLSAYTENTDFLSFINFGGDFLSGGMSINEGNSLVNGDTVSIEIRFGPGLSQKAHRFTVPDNSTSGVPANSYTYQDYIDVPFEVWDITNNRQLMVSFRDQEKDGKFNLYERTGDEYGTLGREYIFVNSVAYDATNPATNIAKTGGHLYKALYMFWPTLTIGATWDENNLPTSKIVVIYDSQKLKNGTKDCIADSYGQYGGANSYDQSAGFGSTYIPGLHPDHHSINLVPTGGGNFLWIDGNDGGIGYSSSNGDTLDQIPVNYLTTQFYGVAKHPVYNEYIGGMQDNGTWQSPKDEEASDTSHYFFRLGGDGFECLWHTNNPLKLLGSIYNNAIYKSVNGGVSWSSATTGIDNGDGPFITRLSASKEKPDIVFAVGSQGVYKSVNFAGTWRKIIISNNWVGSNGLSSSHNVEVSLSNGHIVWAGGAMASDYSMQLQVSTNEGESFTAVPDYSLVAMNAYVSGIATHPFEDSTAYVLFSLSKKPKVLRTRDLGNTWEDISGFGTNEVSSNGFPDVVTHCLLVMPHDANTIWVGTDIGLFESNDNGVSWHLANNGLPPVSVYDMFISGHQVVVATHGRGIWTVDIPDIDKAPYLTDFTQGAQLNLSLESNFKVAYDSVEVYLNNILDTTINIPPTGDNNISLSVNESGRYTAKIYAYISGERYISNTLMLNVTAATGIDDKKVAGLIQIYPNPNSGAFTLRANTENAGNLFVQIFNMNGQVVYMNRFTKSSGLSEFPIQLTDVKKGVYIMKVMDGEKFDVERLIIK